MQWMNFVGGIATAFFSALILAIMDRRAYKVFYTYRRKFLNYRHLKSSHDALVFVLIFTCLWVSFFLSETSNAVTAIEYLGHWAGVAFVCIVLIMYALAYMVYRMLNESHTFQQSSSKGVEEP
ncbi:MAG TPA: hypothetical protein VGL38_13480 [bacterium]|jgi:drug/metabolite transporter (DMT)-like permease